MRLTLGVHPDEINDVNDIEAALKKLSHEEEKVKALLELRVSNRHHIEARLAQVSLLLPALALVASDAQQLQSSVSSTQQLAMKVAAKVRKLDAAKRCVVDVQSRVGDLLDLEGCAGGVAIALRQEDYETAAAHIHRFLGMDQSLLLTSASANRNNSASIESWFDKLRTAEVQLSVLVEERFEEAVRRGDQASVDRFFKLFPLINRKQEGLVKFSAFLCSKVRDLGDQCLAGCDGGSNSRAFGDAASRLFEGVATMVEVRQPLVETYYGPGHLVCVVTELVSEADRQTGRILEALRSYRQVHRLATQLNQNVVGDWAPDPRNLDGLLGECTFLSARADLFLRFMQRRVAADLSAADKEDKIPEVERKLSRCQIACDVAVLVGQYTILEQFYLNSRFEAALSMSTTDTQDAGPKISSIVDDAFYIIKKSCSRAVSSASVDGVCAVINHAVNLIDTKLANAFQTTLKQGFPAQGYMDISQAYSALQTSLATGKLNPSAADTERLREAFLTALNNAETSARHAASLADSLGKGMHRNLSSLGDTGGDKIKSCLEDLESASSRLKSVARFGVAQLSSTAIRPRVKTWLSSFSGANHDITEEELAIAEGELFSDSLNMNASQLLIGFEPLLTPANHEAFTAALVTEVATAFEKAIMKGSFNRLGGLLLDREVRSVVAYLSAVCEGEGRARVTRLKQAATLLNLDNLEEVEEYSSGSAWKLSSSETKKILCLRIDLKNEEIRRLKL